MNKAYKYRIYPNYAQEILINRTFGCVRFIYNQMLANRKSIYEQYKDDKEELRKQKYRLPADFKNDYEWLREVDSLALANAQLNLQTAYQNFFRDNTIGFPKFKSKHLDRKSYTTNNQNGTIRLINDNHLRLPKLKDVRIKLHRRLPEDVNIKSATISKTAAGKYFVAILIEYETAALAIQPTIEMTLGLDYSSPTLYVDNQGDNADYPRFYRKSEQKLQKEQRKLSHRKKGGKNYRKQKLKVARVHEKIANQRKDFLHKRSRQIANVWDAIVVEDIHLRGLSSSLMLGKSTNDNGFGMFRTFLEYKLIEQGKRLIVIDKWFPSSKLCSHCGNVNNELTLADRNWICPNCKSELDRDINAAINIRNEGWRLLQVA